MTLDRPTNTCVFPTPVSMESEVYAATLQLKELQKHYQYAFDAELAMQLFSLQHSWDDQQGRAQTISSSSELIADNSELEQLTYQANNLTNFIETTRTSKQPNLCKSKRQHTKRHTMPRCSLQIA